MGTLGVNGRRTFLSNHERLLDSALAQKKLAREYFERALSRAGAARAAEIGRHPALPHSRLPPPVRVSPPPPVARAR